MSTQSLNWISGASAAPRAQDQDQTNGTTEPSAVVKSVRRLREEYIQERLDMAQKAHQAHYLYRALAARAKAEDTKARYLRLAESEERHLFRHIMCLKKVGYTPPAFRRSWWTRAWQRVLAWCAPNYVHSRLEKMRRAETRRQIDLIRRQASLRPRKSRAQTQDTQAAALHEGQET